MIPFTVQTERKKVRVKLYRYGTGGDFYFRFWFKGKPYNRSTGQQSEHGAKKAVKRLIEEIAAPHAIQQPVSKWVEDFLLAMYPAKEGRTYGDKKFRLNAFAMYMGNREFANLPDERAKQEVVKYLDYRSKEGDKPRSLINHQLVLSRFSNWLMQRGYATWVRNPANRKMMDLPKPVKNIKAPLTDEQAERLLQTEDKVIRMVFALILGCGFRPAGIMRLKWEHFDSKLRTIVVTEKNRVRILPLSDWVYSAMKACECEKGPVWPYNQDSLCKNVKRRAADVGLPEVRLYDCRRTFIFKGFEAGLSSDVVAGIAGNSPKVIERHYLDASRLANSAAVNAISYGKNRRKNRRKKEK